MDENGATEITPNSNNRAGKRWTLNGTTALVTGGTKGIGRAIVEELSRFGATVYTCSRHEVELNRCLQEWQKLGFRVMGSVCDISSRAAREELMKSVFSAFNGKLNILINNAGTVVEAATLEFTAELYSFQMVTNLESGFHLSQLAHPLLKASAQGNILFVSSIGGIIGLQGSSVYAASKGAINQLTRVLAYEWAKDNIRVNCIAPGFIKTPLIQDYVFSEEGAMEAARIPQGRFGESEEVASLAVFLCLPVASYIIGQVICVDGGRAVSG